MTRGLRAWSAAYERRRAAHRAWACRLLSAALAEAWPGLEVAPAISVDGWAHARGTASTGAAFEVRLSPGGMVDVAVDGDVVVTAFPWDGSVNGRTPQAALVESLTEILGPVPGFRADVERHEVTFQERVVERVDRPEVADAESASAAPMSSAPTWHERVVLDALCDGRDGVTLRELGEWTGLTDRQVRYALKLPLAEGIVQMDVGQGSRQTSYRLR